jgi:ribosome biogenesis GTPase
MLVPGDRVIAERRADGSAFVRERLERRSRLERVTPGGRTKIMAANIDTVLIAAAFDRPSLNLQMLDELIAFSELHGLEAMLAFSKADLVPLERAEALTRCYRTLGYAAFVVDARRHHGTTELGSRLASHETLIVGASGVGKSTIFAALGGEAVIGDVSERTGQGRQTTTSGRLLRFDRGALIDSPGIGEFSLEGVDPARLASLWSEFRPYLGRCRFPDCRHLEEPECAVLAALTSGTITASRYQSYRTVALRMRKAAKDRPQNRPR